MPILAGQPLQQGRDINIVKYEDGVRETLELDEDQILEVR